MKVKTILLILVFSSQILTTSLNSVLRNKIITTKPIYDENSASKLVNNIIGSAKLYSKSCDVNQLATISQTVENIVLKIFGKEIIFPFYPYVDMKVLQFSNKFENYKHSKTIEAGEISNVQFSAYIGEKVGNEVSMKVVFGSGSGNAITQYNSERYQSCKTVFFVKKCSWETRNIPRGYTNSEITTINDALQSIAHDKAMDAIPVSLQSGSKNEIIDEVKQGRRVVRGVERENIAEVVAILTGNLRENVEGVFFEDVAKDEDSFSVVIKAGAGELRFFVEVANGELEGKFDIIVDDLEE